MHLGVSYSLIRDFNPFARAFAGAGASLCQASLFDEMFSEMRQGHAFPLDNLSLLDVLLLSIIAYLSYSYIKRWAAYRVCISSSIEKAF
jgi:hypothetical protein